MDENKKEFSKILASCSTEQLKSLAAPVMERHRVDILRTPAKTLVMIRMRETVADSDFYLGETIAAEAMVAVDGHKGFALLMGDALEKALSPAVIDAVWHGNLPEKTEIAPVLDRAREAMVQKRREEAARYARTQVHFHVMDETYDRETPQPAARKGGGSQ